MSLPVGNLSEIKDSYIYPMNVPFISLQKQYYSLESELRESLMRSVMEFDFIKGQPVRDFEKAFSNLLNIPHCISTGNCTDALFIALKCLGVRHGDEIITPAFSWISSSETISLCGAKPVFVDVDTQTYTLNVQQVEAKITPSVKGIIAVHLYGQAAPVLELQQLCKKHNLFLVEDCAQAHLTRDGSQYAGTFGDAAAFSFYPTKNLGAYGDAGCVVTSNDALAEKMRRFANHGALKKDDHALEGTNSRMDSIQAAILLAKLPHLDQWNKKRNSIASQYHEQLHHIHEVTLPVVRPETTHTFHLYVIQTRERDALSDFLLAKGVQTIVHYPAALPNLPAYRYLNHSPEDFPVANSLQERVLSLPLYPELTEEQVSLVCRSIKEFYTR